MFDYKQRPFVKSLTDEEYDRATGRLAAALPPAVRAVLKKAQAEQSSPKPSPTLSAALKILTEVCPDCGSDNPQVREYVPVNYYKTTHCLNNDFHGAH